MTKWGRGTDTHLFLDIHYISRDFFILPSHDHISRNHLHTNHNKRNVIHVYFLPQNSLFVLFCNSTPHSLTYLTGLCGVLNRSFKAIPFTIVWIHFPLRIMRKAFKSLVAPYNGFLSLIDLVISMSGVYCSVNVSYCSMNVSYRK